MIALQGGHLYHYQVRNKKPLLWLSGKSHFEGGKAIRGGIPLCWPWFGKHHADPALPHHGFARTSLFELLEDNEPDEYSTELVLQLQSSAQTLRLWPYHFKLLLHITIGPTLTVSLTTVNCDTRAFTITSALHSYFAVSDIGEVTVQGLDNAEFWDKLTNETKIQKGDIHIGGEVDRVYQETTGPLLLKDSNRIIRIVSEGSSSAVVWNPWIDTSKRMADMQDDAYKTMLCIETANALHDSRRLVPGEEHVLGASFTESI